MLVENLLIDHRVRPRIIMDVDVDMDDFKVS